MTETLEQGGAIKIFGRPGQSQGLLYKHLSHSLINSLILYSPQLNDAPMPKRLELAV